MAKSREDVRKISKEEMNKIFSDVEKLVENEVMQKVRKRVE